MSPSVTFVTAGPVVPSSPFTQNVQAYGVSFLTSFSIPVIESTLKLPSSGDRSAMTSYSNFPRIEAASSAPSTVVCGTWYVSVLFIGVMFTYSSRFSSTGPSPITTAILTVVIDRRRTMHKPNNKEFLIHLLPPSRDRINIVFNIKTLL